MRGSPKQIRETLEKLQGKSSKSEGESIEEIRDSHKQKSEEELAQMEAEVTF